MWSANTATGVHVEGNFLRCEWYFALFFPNLPKKRLCDPRNFLKLLLHSVFRFHAAIDMKIKNSVLEIWFLITNWKKYARLCKNIVRSQPAQYSWASASQLWGLEFHSHSRWCCRQGTSHLTKVGLKLLSSLKTCMWHMWHTWHVSYYVYRDCAMILTTLPAQLHIYAKFNKL